MKKLSDNLLLFNPFKTELFLLKIASFHQFIECDSKSFHKTFIVFKEIVFLICYAKAPFEIRAFDG